MSTRSPEHGGVPKIGYGLWNGLGDGTSMPARYAQLWWGIRGQPLEHYPINWESRRPIERQIEDDARRIRESGYDRFVGLGSSAAAAYVLHLMKALEGSSVEFRAVCAHGWLLPPDAEEHEITLAEQAKMELSMLRNGSNYDAPEGNKPYFRFRDSTMRLLPETLDDLTDDQRSRILVCRASRDQIVPESLRLPTQLEGAEVHEVRCIGHKSAFIGDVMRVGLITSFGNKDIEPAYTVN